MKKNLVFAIVIALAVLAETYVATRYFNAPSVPSQAPRYVHFCIVPQQLPNGQPSNALVGEFKQYCLSVVGGYTKFIEVEGGWLGPQGKLEVEKNHAFLLTTNKNIAPQLRQYIVTRFQQQEAFVLVWPSLE